MSGVGFMRWLVFLVGGSLAALGCSTDSEPRGASGSLSLELVLADDVVINYVSWEISGGDMEPMSGVIDVRDPRSTPSVEVFGLPSGEGYLVELAAMSEGDEVSCEGSADFDVVVGVATDVMVVLKCKLPTDFGDVRVNGKFNICAQLHKVVVSPLQTSVGSDIELAAAGHDEEADSIRYSWSGTGGSIADPSAASTTYTCAEGGGQTITVTISDDDFEHCMDDWVVSVTCIDKDLCEDVDCDDGNECTDDDCDSASGTCTNTPIEDGAVCDGGAGQCTSGQCIVIDLCEEVDCDDGNECTEDDCDPTDGSCGNTPVDDGSECNGGAGTCVQGTCVDINLCEGVDCSSGNECVEDGSCDPSTGMCTAGDNKPAGTACSLGGFCDGAGNCKVNTCAELDQAVISPLQTSVGSQISLSAVGSDQDGDAVAYLWTGTGGSVAEPSAPSTTYTCGQAGEQEITIAVSDDDFEFCIDDLTVPVICVVAED